MVPAYSKAKHTNPGWKICFTRRIVMFPKRVCFPNEVSDHTILSPPNEVDENAECLCRRTMSKQSSPPPPLIFACLKSFPTNPFHFLCAHPLLYYIPKRPPSPSPPSRPFSPRASTSPSLSSWTTSAPSPASTRKWLAPAWSPCAKSARVSLPRDASSSSPAWPASSSRRRPPPRPAKVRFIFSIFVFHFSHQIP